MILSERLPKILSMKSMPLLMALSIVGLSPAEIVNAVEQQSVSFHLSTAVLLKPDSQDTEVFKKLITESVYKMTLTRQGLPTQYCSAVAIDPFTLLVAGHCGRIRVDNQGRVVRTVDENGNPLYNASTKKGNRQWKLNYIRPRGVTADTESIYDIALWKSDRPFPFHLKKSRKNLKKESEGIQIVHFPWVSSTPIFTPADVLWADDQFMTLGTTSQPMHAGSSGGAVVDSSGYVYGVFTADLPRSDPGFNRHLNLVGVQANSGRVREYDSLLFCQGINALVHLYGTN